MDNALRRLALLFALALPCHAQGILAPILFGHWRASGHRHKHLCACTGSGKLCDIRTGTTCAVELYVFQHIEPAQHVYLTWARGTCYHNERYAGRDGRGSLFRRHTNGRFVYDLRVQCGLLPQEQTPSQKLRNRSGAHAP